MEKTYTEKNFFSFAAYEQLLKKIGTAVAQNDLDARDDSEAITKAFDSFHEYVTVVDHTETAIKLAQFELDGEDLRLSISRYDTLRKHMHEGAMSKVGLVNSLAKFYGVESPIFVGDKTDRYQVADFCLEVTVKIFEHRKK